METQSNGMMVGSDMNQVVEMPADSFERVVKGSDKPVIVEFWIKSCGNCQKFRSVYEKLPEIFSDKVEFLKKYVSESGEPEVS
jgi:thioredoxin-like negative regulator of GroEL